MTLFDSIRGTVYIWVAIVLAVAQKRRGVQDVFGTMAKAA